MNATATPMIRAWTVRSMLFLLISLLIVALVSVIGSAATRPVLSTWYAALNKPWFNPPNWAFPLAWTTLFLLMAFSFWRILRQVDGGQPRNTAIFAFFIQLLFNLGWSFAFFAGQSPLAGLFVVAGLIASVAAMIVTFRRIDPLAGNLQLPYLGWVCFAAVLNLALWQLN
jgi:translocator protein